MSPVREYTQDTHHFFNQLVTFLGAFTTFAMGVRAQVQGSTPKFPENMSIILGGKPHVSNMRLKFYPHDLLQYFVDQSWPDSLKFHDLPMVSEKSDNSRPSFSVPEVGKYVNYLIMYTFISYFESNKADLKSIFGECQT